MIIPAMALTICAQRATSSELPIFPPRRAESRFETRSQGNAIFQSSIDNRQLTIVN
jgi:hypothetical protein